ncbi:MAG: hypothetical protein CME34_03155 [Gordonia sp.]|uniref:hypothetical protein n=1 Tax=Gordonia sp. (in: high G+C Gram-positive bacteria) TaxID=84139 RepID=UPI000C55AE60|nr:hypothetical protein [Gordonia sp. (in: high G+C Gram-positive bacteria)]MAU80868.1 hypothetical protein [Gordonia sp. (in: high G+C Gram-positive bacteria)]
MTPFDPSNLLAEIEADDAAEVQALAERQRRRREALEPAAQLAAEIATTREHFLAEDRQRLSRLAELVKEAKKNGAPTAKLDQLHFAPLTAQARGGRSRSGASKPRAQRSPATPDKHTEPAQAGSEQTPTPVSIAG